jgi:hypothetical protein
VNLGNIGVARGLCRITGTEFDRAGADLQVRFDERNSRVFDTGIGTFRQRMINALAKSLPSKISLKENGKK